MKAIAMNRGTYRVEARTDKQQTIVHLIAPKELKHGERIVGVYHTHPVAGPPSPADVSHRVNNNCFYPAYVIGPERSFKIKQSSNGYFRLLPDKFFKFGTSP